MFVLESIRDVESKFLLSKSHVLSWHETREENIDTLSNSKRHGNDTIGSGLSV